MRRIFCLYSYTFLLIVCAFFVSLNSIATPHSFEHSNTSNFVIAYCTKNVVKSDSINNLIVNSLLVKTFQGKKAFYFANPEQLDSSLNIHDLIRSVKSFTFEFFILNQYSRFDTLSQDVRTDNSINLEWQHIVISYDGNLERGFINGKLIFEKDKQSFRPGIDRVGLLGALSLSHFSGYISNLKFVNYAYDDVDVGKALSLAHHSEYLYALESADYDIGPISELVGYDGSSKLITSSCKGCEVTVQKQRMSFKLNSLVCKDLTSLLRSQLWRLTIEYLHNGKWSQVFIDKNGSYSSVYVDGLITDKVLSDYLVIRDNEIKFRFKNIHNIRIYKHNEVNVRDLYDEFKNRVSLNLVNKKIAVKTPPQKINDSNLFLALENDTPYLQYKFYMGFSSSPWLGSPNYLFNGYNGHINIDVQIRDIYGNVSKKMSIPVQYPKLLLRTDQDHFDWILGDSISDANMWQHMIDTNSIRDNSITISKGFQGWMLGSKSNAKMYSVVKKPFLFNAIDKNFTIELKVEDISGQLSNNLEDNEVGIIVQRVDNDTDYITNSVNTVNNLGNVASYHGPSGFVIKGNNLGLRFHKYLQIQRSGHYFYLRTSRDGSKWENLVNTPINLTHWGINTLKLGIYQFSNSHDYKYGLLSNVKIWLIDEPNE